MLKSVVEVLTKKVTNQIYDIKNIEIEAVFYQYPNKSGVSKNTFFIVKNILDSKYKCKNLEYEDIFIKTLDNIEIRKSVSDITTYTLKEKKFTNIIGEYEFKINISTETPYNEVNGVIQSIRKKNRFSYDLNGATADLTIVNEMYYEIELETEKFDKNFLNKIEELIKYIQNTNCIYTIGKSVFNTNTKKYDIIPLEKMNLISSINKIFRFDDSMYFDKKIEIKLSNLKFHHLTYDKLFNIEYRVALKTDGEHKFLTCTNDGVYLFSLPNNVNKIYSTLNMKPETRIVYNNLIGSVLEGEYIKSLNIFVCFDCLGIKNQTFKDLRNYNHSKRLFESMNFINMFNTLEILKIDTKTFFDISYGKDYIQNNNFFIKGVETCLNLKTEYETDGLVFIPNVKFIESIGITYKWKPFEKLSIDFLFKRTESGDIDLLYGDNINTSFKGSNKFNFENSYITESFDNVLNDQIVECVGVKMDNKIYLKKYRIRYDKNEPNYKDICMDVWNDMNDNIDEDTLLDKNLKRSRKYQNSVKRKLLNDVLDKSVLVDIGSGRGGDLSKWTLFDEIYCIEPDTVNINEFNKRLNVSDIKNRVHIIEQGGEVEFNIPCTCISSMLSLSFFAGDKLINMCKNIVKNLKVGGEFIFLTINGYMIRKLFSNTKKLNLNECQLEFFPETNELSVKIDDSIVRGQIEYLVDLCKIEKILTQNGFVLEYIKQCNDEKMFGPVERQYNSLYSYGKFKKIKNVDFTINNIETSMSIVERKETTRDFVQVDKVDEIAKNNYISTKDIYHAILTACCSIYQETKTDKDYLAEIFHDQVKNMSFQEIANLINIGIKNDNIMYKTKSDKYIIINENKVYYDIIDGFYRTIFKL